MGLVGIRLLTSTGVTVAIGAFTLALPVSATDTTPACPDPFEFLGPSITLSDRDRQRLDAGRPYIRVLPGADREIAVLAAVAVDFDGDRVAAWMRHIEALKKSAHVPAVGRFSDPAGPADMAAHEFGDDDLQHLRDCTLENCDVKLTAAEIAEVRAALDTAGDDWRPAAQDVFRRIAADRVTAYRRAGLQAVGPWADGHSETPPADVHRMLVDRSPYLTHKLPRVADHLAGFPHGSVAGAESFIYWSIDRFGGRPVTSATHVIIVRPQGPDHPDVLVAGKQIFATHYQNGSLSLTMLLRGCPGPPHYLVYINRSSVDVVRGMMGWFARRIIEGRVEDDAGVVLSGLRDRMSKTPPR